MAQEKGEAGEERKVWSRIKQCFWDCPGRSFLSFQPLIYAVLVFGVGYYVLSAIAPPELARVADIDKTETPPIHLAAASSLALFVVGLASIVLASYTICNLERCRCCFFAIWF